MRGDGGNRPGEGDGVAAAQADDLGEREVGGEEPAGLGDGT